MRWPDASLHDWCCRLGSRQPRGSGGAGCVHSLRRDALACCLLQHACCSFPGWPSKSTVLPYSASHKHQNCTAAVHAHKDSGFRPHQQCQSTSWEGLPVGMGMGRGMGAVSSTLPVLHCSQGYSRDVSTNRHLLVGLRSSAEVVLLETPQQQKMTAQGYAKALPSQRPQLALPGQRAGFGQRAAAQERRAALLPLPALMLWKGRWPCWPPLSA